MADLSGMSLAELSNIFGRLFREVHALIGPVADHRCSICMEMASMHVNGDTNGCTNEQIDEDAVKTSLELQIKSAEDLLGRLRAVGSLSRQVSRLSDENDNLRRTVSNRDGALSDGEESLPGKQLPQDEVINEICCIWRSYMTGSLDAHAVSEKLRDDFGYDLPLGDIPSSFSPSTHPVSSAPAASAAAAALIAPAPSTALHQCGITRTTVSGGEADGDKVGKSTKTIKVEFQFDDSAIQHLQKERSLLNEMDLLYPSVNAKTKISMVISHCDVQVKGIAMTVRDASCNGFPSVDAFLSAFRNERYPNFHSECRLAFKEMQQVAPESAMQFFFRFSYLLRAMNRNIEEYHDEYMDKLLYPEVVEHVRFQPRSGRTLQFLAMHCNEVESEMKCRKGRAVSQTLAHEDGKGCDVLVTSSRHGQKDSDTTHQSGYGYRGTDWVPSAFARADTWELKAGTCWHCFGAHPLSENDECHQKPCLFCKRTGHKSFYCFNAPATKDEFQSAVKMAA